MEEPSHGPHLRTGGLLVLEHREAVRSTGMKITRAKISGHCLVTVARPFSMPFGAFRRTLRGCLFR